MNLNKICELIQDAEREAAGLIMHAHGILAEKKTGRRDVVTEYDRRVQTLLTERLLSFLPEAQFFSEELESQGSPDAEQLFIIDPIDGTMNFVHGFHCSCISVAYAERGTLCAGVIYNPYTDEMFSAVLGQGASCNGRSIRVTEDRLRDTIACFGTSPYYPELADRTFQLARKFFDESLDLRRDGSAALDLCSVAAGRAGVYFEQRVSLWDYAAGALIVREAGGVCCCIDGSELPFDGKKSSILAGSPQTVREFLNIINQT